MYWIVVEINILSLDANERMLYYMAPDSSFLYEPEKLNYYIQSLAKQVSTIAQPESIMKMTHELQKVFNSILLYLASRYWSRR